MNTTFRVLTESFYNLSFHSIAPHMKTNLLWMSLFVCLKIQSQNFSYTHYGVQEGLAGSLVYAAVQDKDGFMWFATETGVSRFDGTHFKNFTIEEGLPDNEILNLFCDSKGRIWMMPFRKTICYYYKGKLHTQENDTLLKKLQVTGNIFFIEEDRNGNLLLGEQYKIHYIPAKSNNIDKFQTKNIYVDAIATDANGSFWIFSEFSVFKFNNGKLSLVNKYPHRFNLGEIGAGKLFFADKAGDTINLIQYATNSGLKIISSEKHFSFSFLDDSIVSDNTSNGAFIYNIGVSHRAQHHLAGKTISRVYQDNEGNLWFCTQCEGVYKLNSPYVSNQFFNDDKGNQLSIHSLTKFRNKLWIGTGGGHLFTLVPGRGQPMSESYTDLMANVPRNETRVLLKTKDEKLLVGMQKRIVSTSLEQLYVEGSLKDITPAYDENILASTSSGVWLINHNEFNKAKTDKADAVWNGRATTAHYSKDTFYIGTLDGLYKVTRAGEKFFTGDDDPLLKSRIAAIRETPDGTLWIATYDRGIVAYKNRRVILNINREKGLSSNICRCLFLTGNHLWVGTDNGLNKIVIDGTNFRITKYSNADGLLSNFINAVCADDSLVYVGTPEGVSYFDDKKISQHAPSIFRLTNITVSGSEVDPITRSFTLARRDNNIRFEYAGISYRSGGEIIYRYRLTGLDTGWQFTTSNFLNYPTLLPKSYVMDIQAINKFGIASEIISIPFTIKKYWWEKTGVQIVGLLLVLSAIALFMNRRIKQVRLREKEKNLLREQVSSLEQMALKAQMNPHFIFNSLNSIQHYVLDKDVVGANKYISGFSKLIRLTLDNSSKSEIPIEEEIEYLSQYLELEKMRTDNKFSYSINVSDKIVHEGYTVSPMVLQPFVENCIRHGIRYRNDSKGHIRIDIFLCKNGLEFIIEDNGVGREVAESYKSRNPIEYQSKGISLTKQRISLMNVYRKEKIEMLVSDVKENGTITGTKVVINYPINNIQNHDKNGTG